jgi:hypothetical protein
VSICFGMSPNLQRPRPNAAPPRGGPCRADLSRELDAVAGTRQRDPAGARSQCLLVLGKSRSHPGLLGLLLLAVPVERAAQIESPACSCAQGSLFALLSQL